MFYMILGYLVYQCTVGGGGMVISCDPIEQTEDAPASPISDVQAP